VNVLIGRQLEVQNIGVTSSESSYVVSVPRSKEENSASRRILQEEMINLRRNTNGKGSREGSVDTPPTRSSSGEASPTKKSMSSTSSRRGSEANAHEATSPVQALLNRFGLKEKTPPSPGESNNKQGIFGRTLGELKHSFSKVLERYIFIEGVFIH